ncbi:MAG: hypothetical protein U9R79_14650 [Armatimonadota bacterium]|nr:hypothetical protein [Armatimonadota bacterium]
MSWGRMAGAALLLAGTLAAADMDDDAEARELLARFEAMGETGRYVDDGFDQDAERQIHGPVGFGPGRSGRQDDRAAVFPASDEREVYVYYGPYVALRGGLAFDFTVIADPGRERPWTVLQVGTAGNMAMLCAVTPDGVLHATITTRRGRIPLFTDPLSFGEWHSARLLYGPEGSVLVVDGAIQDFAIDPSVPWNYDSSNAMYLGDRPYWSARRREGYFAEHDHLVGSIDNLSVVRLEPGGEEQ